jgi:DNA-binding transcriptional MerR regulator
MSTTVAQRLHTIGAVCRRLQPEFPDISISKIRYLEDQGLLAPKRTQGGYRLFSEEDVERLEKILRLQRDEFLPLRVIRQELASPTPTKERRRRRPAGLGIEEEDIGLGELCETAGITVQFARELEDFGLLDPKTRDSEKRYPETDVGVASLCARLAKYGLAPRNLRKFRTDADGEADLLERIVMPSLMSRSPERRQGGLEDLQQLAEHAQELVQLLFWRRLRRSAAR